MKVNISDIPQEIIDEYNVMIYANEDGYVYLEIMGAIYGLKQQEKLQMTIYLNTSKNLDTNHPEKYQGCGYTKLERSASPWLWMI